MDTDFKKNDGGKPRWTMVPFVAVDKVVGVLEYGAGKYGKDNWKKGCGRNNAPSNGMVES